MSVQPEAHPGSAPTEQANGRMKLLASIAAGAVLATGGIAFMEQQSKTPAVEGTANDIGGAKGVNGHEGAQSPSHEELVNTSLAEGEANLTEAERTQVAEALIVEYGYSDPVDVAPDSSYETVLEDIGTAITCVSYTYDERCLWLFTNPGTPIYEDFKEAMQTDSVMRIGDTYQMLEEATVEEQDPESGTLTLLINSTESYSNYMDLQYSHGHYRLQ